MQTISYTDARNNLKDVLDEVCDHEDAVTITRKEGNHCVVMSLDTYNSMVATAHLLSSPANVERLVKSIEQLSKGKTHERNLVE